MKIKYILLAFLFAFHFTNAEVLISEDFESGIIPENWLLIDRGGFIPHPLVSHFNDAWIIQEYSDTEGSGYNIQSNSMYLTPEWSQNWFITSESLLLENTKYVLSWKSKSLDSENLESYFVYISKTDQSINGCGYSEGNHIYNVIDESADSFNTHQVILLDSIFKNQNIYICFLHNSYDKSILMIDDIELKSLDNDLQLSSPKLLSEYSIIPNHYAGEFKVDVTNNGSNPQSDFIISANIYNEPYSAPIMTSTFNYGNTLMPGTTSTIMWEFSSFNELGLSTGVNYTVAYTVDLAGTLLDQTPDNNTISVPDSVFELSSNQISRYIYNSDKFSPLVTQNMIAKYGVVLEFDTSLNINSVDFTYDNSDCQIIGGETLCAFTDQSLTVEVYSMIEKPEFPDQLLGTSVPHIVPPIDQIYSIQASTTFSPALQLLPGKYLFSIVQPLRNTLYPNHDSTQAAIRLHGSPTNFSENSNWLKWLDSPTGDWVNVEYFGKEFERTYNIKVNFDYVIFKDSFE